MIQYKRIGEMLLDSGLINQKQLDNAMKTKLGTTLRFGEILTALGYVTEEEITHCLADQYGYRVADMAFIEPEPEAIQLVPSITALSSLVLPVKVTDDRFYCIIADPLDIPMTDSLFRMAGRPVEFSLSTPTEIFDAIVRAYGLGPRTRNLHLGSQTSSFPLAEVKKKATPKPARKVKVKIDPQDDKFALLAALTAEVSGA